MQGMTKMMERMNFVMGNVCDRLEKVGKHDNVLEHVPKTRQRLGAESKSRSGSRVERPRWAGYEDFKEDVDDTIQARSNSDFGRNSFYNGVPANSLGGRSFPF
jgi:hypothetical protein